MPFGLADVVGVGSTLSGLSGLLGANAARARAQEAIRRILLQAETDLNTNLGRQRREGERSLYAATGQGGDALRTLSAQMGENFANAGVYNSSAVTGGLNQANQNLSQNLLQLAAQNQSNLTGQEADNTRYLTQLKMGAAQNELGRADANYGSAYSGLMGGIGSLAQFNLARTGAVQKPGMAGNGMMNSVLQPLAQPGIPDLRSILQKNFPTRTNYQPPLTLGRKLSLSGGWG